MVQVRRTADIVVVMGDGEGAIRQDQWHVWVRFADNLTQISVEPPLWDSDGAVYLAELPMDTSTAGWENGAADAAALPLEGTLLMATPKGTAPPASNELKIDPASLPL